MLVDARRGAGDGERELARYLAEEEIPARAALTQCDKLGRGELERARRALAAALGLPEEHVAAVSADHGTGLAPVAAWLREWSGVEFKRPDGASF